MRSFFISFGSLCWTSWIKNTGYVPAWGPLTGAEASMLLKRRRLQIICGPTRRCFRNTLPSQELRDSLTFVMQNHRGQDIWKRYIPGRQITLAGDCAFLWITAKNFRICVISKVDHYSPRLFFHLLWGKNKTGKKDNYRPCSCGNTHTRPISSCNGVSWPAKMGCPSLSTSVLVAIGAFCLFYEFAHLEYS